MSKNEEASLDLNFNQEIFDPQPPYSKMNHNLDKMLENTIDMDNNNF
jgi:hypothetical protein